MSNSPKKQNMSINGEWAQHVREWWKKYTSHKRRMRDKEIIKKEINEF